MRLFRAIWRKKSTELGLDDRALNIFSKCLAAFNNPSFDNVSKILPVYTDILEGMFYYRNGILISVEGHFGMCVWIAEDRNIDISLTCNRLATSFISYKKIPVEVKPAIDAAIEACISEIAEIIPLTMVESEKRKLRKKESEEEEAQRFIDEWSK